MSNGSDTALTSADTFELAFTIRLGEARDETVKLAQACSRLGLLTLAQSSFSAVSNPQLTLS